MKIKFIFYLALLASSFAFCKKNNVDDCILECEKRKGKEKEKGKGIGKGKEEN